MHCLTKILFIMFRTNVRKCMWAVFHKDSQLKVLYKKYHHIENADMCIVIFSVNSN